MSPFCPATVGNAFRLEFPAPNDIYMGHHDSYASETALRDSYAAETVLKSDTSSDTRLE
jgi:hypothetical protein